HYPGLSNSSSGICFLNAVLQALASITDLSNYLNDLRVTKSEDKISLIDRLSNLLKELNSPRTYPLVLRPTEVIQALVSNLPRSINLFNSNDQQDAHELLLAMIQAIEEEAERNSGLSTSRKRGLASLLDNQSSDRAADRTASLQNPFRGWMANRVACAACGFSGGIQHSPTDHLSFILPAKSSCTLDECLEDFTRLELLDQYNCQKCTFLKAQSSLLNYQSSSSSSSSSIKSSSSIRRKTKEIREALCQINLALKEDDMDREFNKILQQYLIPVSSQMTTKQIMFARPPNILIFHFSRSTIFSSGKLYKNNCQLIFPEILIIDRFTTTPELCGRAEAPISRSDKEVSTNDLHHVYRLTSAIIHLGNHTSGHYLAFRKVPTGTWWRTSDEDVSRCEPKEVLSSNPTLLIYQRL
ncbi:hypothetical protein BY996DRAFT_4580385, partial [Phakopsora pachyrhizi]